jgi:hypothetical protein
MRLTLMTSALLCTLLAPMSGAIAQELRGRDVPETPAETFAHANKLYLDENYAGAAEGYQRLLDDGYRTLPIYYNLADAFMQMNDVGRAVLYYRRALLVAPRNADVLHNLRHAERQLVQQPSTEVESWAHFVLAAVWARFTINELATVTVVLFWLVTALLIYLMHHTTRRLVRVIFWGLVIALLLSAVLTCGKWQGDYCSGAAMIISETDMMSGPGRGFEALATLTPGTEVTVLQTQGQYSEIRTKAGGRGWLICEHLEVISPYCR